MKQAFELIQQSKRILLHLHPKPDPDSVGSALATYHALLGLGKEVTVIQGDSKLSDIFSCLPGYENIVRKNYFEINLNDFDLFIIQDSGSKQMITRLGEVVFPSHLKTIIIDHHKTNEKFADINLVDSSYVATSEFLYDLFLEWGAPITPDIAACLFIAIHSDTGGFKYSQTTPRTMKIAAELAVIYPDFPHLVYDIENNYTKGKIYFDALALNSIETFFDNTVALSSVSFEVMKKHNITREDSDSNQIANTLISVKEWGIGITLIEKSPGEISISFRSKKKDISGIVVSLGGGGHAFAAGATLRMTLEEAKNKVIDALQAAW